MTSRVFPGDFSSLASIGDFILECARLGGLDEKATYAVQLAVDEACSNIIEHAYGGEGKGEIALTCNLTGEGLEVVLSDWGDDFDPKAVPKLDIAAPLEETGDRGAGVFLMRKLMDEVRYEFSKAKGTTLVMLKKRN